MASRNKKSTVAKLARESRLRERRLEKQARKKARKQASNLERLPPEAPRLDDGRGEQPLGADDPHRP